MTSFEKITPLPFLSDLLRTNAFTYAMRQNEANRTLHSAFKTAKELDVLVYVWPVTVDGKRWNSAVKDSADRMLYFRITPSGEVTKHERYDRFPLGALDHGDCSQ